MRKNKTLFKCKKSTKIANTKYESTEKNKK